MSNIDTNATTLAVTNGAEVTPAMTHTVVAYEQGKTKTLAGQRLDVVFWKTGKDGVKKDSKCVSVPLVTAEEVTSNLSALMPHIIDFISGVQHDIIKERVTDGALHITQQEIAVSSCVEYLDSNVRGADGKSAHLTKDSVAAWFDSVVADNLMLALAEKLGIGNTPTDEQINKLDKAIAMYRTEVSKLAGGKTTFGIPLAKSIKNALSLVPTDDPIALKFIPRLDKMIASGDELFDLL